MNLICEQVKSKRNITWFASTDDKVDVMFYLLDAVIEPEELTDKSVNIPVIFTGDLKDTIPCVRVVGNDIPLRVNIVDIHEPNAQYQIEFKLRDDGTYYECSRGVIW